MDRFAFQQDIGLRIQLQRKSRGYKQREVAARLGVSRATYASIESGRQRVTLDIAWKLAVILGTTVNGFLPEPLWSQGTTAHAIPIGTAINEFIPNKSPTSA